MDPTCFAYPADSCRRQEPEYPYTHYRGQQCNQDMDKKDESRSFRPYAVNLGPVRRRNTLTSQQIILLITIVVVSKRSAVERVSGVEV